MEKVGASMPRIKSVDFPSGSTVVSTNKRICLAETPLTVENCRGRFRGVTQFQQTCRCKYNC